MEEILLVYGLQQHMESSLEQVILKYGNLVFYVIRKLLGESCTGDIEELVSDTFFELWERADWIDLKRGSLKNLICIIARSRAVDYLRKNKKYCGNVELEEDLIQDGVDPEEQFIHKEELLEVYSKIGGMQEPISSILRT